MNLSFLRDQDGNVVGIQGVTRDITERKTTEEALRESEDKLREAQTIARLGRWDLDLSTGDLLWSEGIFELFEISPENFAASYDAFFDFVHPDDRSFVHNAFKDSVESRRPYEIEHRLLMNDGRVKWVNEIGRTEYDELGKPLRAFGTVQDITERKLVEENLRDRNFFIETVLDNLPIGLAINRIQEGVSTYVNRQFESIYGWPKEEITNIESFFEKVYPDPEYRNKLKTQVLTDIATGDPARMRWENIEATAKDGTKRIIVAQNIPLVEQNIMISTVQDETQRVLAEKQRNNLQSELAQAQKMESVGRLAGGVAHDYNNMLSVISGYTELALEKLQPGDPLHTDLTEVYKAAARSIDITRQLLAFARKQTIAPKVIDLNANVESMLRLLRRLIGEDIELAWHPGKRLWTVKMDPAQVDQILANLCVNARDAIGGVGKVTIETDNISIDADYCETNSWFAPGEFVMLIISDNGCGMDPETQKHIFEPFFSTKGAEKGTGLGLATVYGIVKQNAGYIDVYSEPGKGTTFRIYLPRHVGDMQPAQIQKKAATPVSHGETVLIVEDEPSILRMGEIILQRLGYDVLAAGTPQMAMDLARKHPGEIDLLITDVVMPGMNGRELAKELNALYPKLKTIFMSGYTASVIAHRGVLEEGMDFIQKPFSLHDLGSKIRSVLDERTRHRQL